MTPTQNKPVPVLLPIGKDEPIIRVPYGYRPPESLAFPAGSDLYEQWVLQMAFDRWSQWVNDQLQPVLQLIARTAGEVAKVLEQFTPEEQVARERSRADVRKKRREMMSRKGRK